MLYDLDDLIPVRCENEHKFSIMWGEDPEEYPCPFCKGKVELDSD